MKYMDVATASSRWGITGRRVRILCNDGRIDGAVRNGWTWMIPSDAPKPGDGRVMRRYRNLEVRPGTVDAETLSSLKEEFPLEKSRKAVDAILPRTVSFLFSLSGEDVHPSEIQAVISGRLSYDLLLRDHILIINFTALLRSELRRTEKWGEGAVRDLWTRLMQGIEESDGEWRDNGEGNMDMLVSTLMRQYQESWSSLHAISGGAILTGELGKLGIYGRYLPFLLYLVLAGELARSGFLPPFFDPSMKAETMAAWSLVARKGVYTDMTALLERMVMLTYSEAGRNV